MGIEPIGSIMTLQAQPTITRTVNENSAENTDVETANPEVAKNAPDMSTQVVEGTSGKGNANTDDNGAEQQTPAELTQATHEQIKQAVEKFNKASGANSEAVFGIHEETNRVTIKIVDKTTKKVIKELPPEKTLDMIAKVWEMAGILVDEKR